MSAGSVSSGELEVPFGVDAAGILIPVDDALKAESYSCPGCGSLLILRAGEIKRKHFAHAAHGDCSSESILHKTAKRLIVHAVTDWKQAGAAAPCVVNTCSLCADTRDDPMPDRIISAREECVTQTGYRVDVGLFDADGLCAAVEVMVTHAVDDEKAGGLGQLSWIEVEAVDILGDPTHWVPINGMRTWDLHGDCGCREWMHAKLHAYCQRIAEKTGQVLPETGFLYGPHRCWICHEEMIVYAWEANLHDEGGAPPSGVPCPPTIEYVYSKTSECSYHANCCPRCKYNQGHFYLHAEPDGPFFGIEEYRRGEEQLGQALIALHLRASRLLDASIWSKIDP